VAHLLFRQLTKPNKKSKRATKPTHQDSSKQWTEQQPKTEGQLVTRAKSKRADSGNLKSIATNKLYRKLTVLCFEMPASS